FGVGIAYALPGTGIFVELRHGQHNPVGVVRDAPVELRTGRRRVFVVIIVLGVAVMFGVGGAKDRSVRAVVVSRQDEERVPVRYPRATVAGCWHGDEAAYEQERYADAGE